jgi:hypothetical protein
MLIEKPGENFFVGNSGHCGNGGKGPASFWE